MGDASFSSHLSPGDELLELTLAGDHSRNGNWLRGTRMGSSPGIARLTVRCEPTITDPRELHTILIFSLRSLWGELESHSDGLEVTKCTAGNPIDVEFNSKNHYLMVSCPIASVPAVRAALTLVTPPPYLESTVYQFDILNIKSEPL